MKIKAEHDFFISAVFAVSFAEASRVQEFNWIPFYLFRVAKISHNTPDRRAWAFYVLLKGSCFCGHETPCEILACGYERDETQATQKRKKRGSVRQLWGAVSNLCWGDQDRNKLDR